MKKVLYFIVGIIVCLPAFLAFTESSEGTPTVFNFIGIGYMLLLSLAVRYIIRKH